jgi:hypothetical protein
MKWGRAFWSGVIAGAVMTILMAFARASGMPVNMSLMLGTLTGLAPSPGAWLIGFAMHLAISGLIAFSYAWGFETVSHRANAGIGTLFAAMHVVLAGFFLGVIPAIHPFMPTQINPPGIFLANLGVAGIVAFVALHLLYGVIVGGMYGPIRHAHRAAARGERPVAAH